MIKAIAVDMDGTFLNSASDFDHPYFEKIFSRLQNHDITFVVASGNPYYQLRGRFPNHINDMSFVAENGVELFDHGQMIYCGEIAPATIQKMYEFYHKTHNSTFLISGLHHAFFFNGTDPEYLTRVKKHYPKYKMIDSLAELDDKIVKMQMDVPVDKVLVIQKQINEEFAGKITATSSGYGNLDLIVAGLHKATGLSKLMEIHNWQKDELMAFGDGQNDITMLKLVGESYAMANGDRRVIDIANHVAPRNDDNGVLKTIEKYLDTL